MRKTVVVGVSSGIAAYKSLKLITFLKKEGVEVFVIMTKSATTMVDPLEFEKASENRVYTELFEKGFDYKVILKHRKVDHIELADKANVFVVAPATANIIAKIAHGLADDFLTTTILATQAPILICPSMNVNMWRNPLVRENVSKLKKLGYHIVEPENGMLACGYEGEGRLSNIECIRDEIMHLLWSSTLLKGKNVLVTTGGTIERIDGVRHIANRSSGKMGTAIAEECFLQGANVLLLRATNSVRPRYAMQEEIFETADDLMGLIRKYTKNYDIFYHVAAVSDFSVENAVNGKLSSNDPFMLKLKPREKILDRIKKLNPRIRLVAFKAEWGLKEKELVEVAYKRLQKCSADAIVANDISKKDRGFGVDTNEVFVVLPDGTYKKIPLSSKRSVAKKVVEFTVIEQR